MTLEGGKLMKLMLVMGADTSYFYMQPTESHMVLSSRSTKIRAATLPTRSTLLPLRPDYRWVSNSCRCISRKCDNFEAVPHVTRGHVENCDIVLLEVTMLWLPAELHVKATSGMHAPPRTVAVPVPQLSLTRTQGIPTSSATFNIYNET